MVGSVYAASVSSAAISTLADAMNQRMLDMRAVAGYKAANHKPVEDLIREHSVLILSHKDAEDAGLDPESVKPFTQAQMDVAKAIQYRYFAQWLSETTPPCDQKDLDDVRASISVQDRIILNAISQRLLTGSFSNEDKSEIFSLLHAPHLTDADRARLINSLSLIKRVN